MSFLTLSRAHVAAALFAFAIPALAQAEGIEVHDAYAIAALPTSVSGAAFMVIQNQSEAPDRLIDVRSDAAERVELHTHIEDENGVMQMVHVEEGFDLPAGAELLLQRGGHHVMFMGLTEPFVQGRILTVTLVFETAGEVVIEVPVDLERMTTDTMDHGAMDADAMDGAMDGDEAPVE